MVSASLTKNQIVLMLSHHPKIGGQTIKKLNYIYNGDLVKIFSDQQKMVASLLGQKIAEYVVEATAYSLESIESRIKREAIGYITMFDDAYPRNLLELPDAPAILFVKGDARVLNEASIAIVGSRRFTAYGSRVARKISSELARHGVPVVSGLALGIDSIVHQAVVEEGGKTIGVLACGLDEVYPSSNKSLADKILALNGAIISEYPPGTEPFKSNFPARNRIIAGLSEGTLVVEAAVKSGALITAMAALDYNKDVFAVPGPIDSESSEGTNWLIQQGAKLVTQTEDILAEVRVEAKKNIRKVKEFAPESEEESLIVAMVSGQPSNSDDICRGSGLNIAKVSYTLTMLEMKGILENVGGIWTKKI